jgi:hypothetical protein
MLTIAALPPTAAAVWNFFHTIIDRNEIVKQWSIPSTLIAFANVKTEASTTKFMKRQKVACGSMCATQEMVQVAFEWFGLRASNKTNNYCWLRAV